jgi:RNA recognition motif-containing protein
MVGDLPFANVLPPENVLFVCKLNPVTRDEDLELIFSRFGSIMSCQVIRDKKTGDSLQYAFIEFDKREDAEQVCDTIFIVFEFGLMATCPTGLLQNAKCPRGRSPYMG